jgi:hypothetical protein
MRLVLAILALVLLAEPAAAQIPPEWEAAAQLVIGELEQIAPPPQARDNWGEETREGWRLARAWRTRNNGNVEIILAEYLTFTALCRQPGCPGNTIEGRGYTEMAAEVKALRAEHGGPYALAGSAHAWLAGLDDPTGAAAKNAALWGKDLDVAAADFATGNLYALYWLLARTRPTQPEQAAAFSRFALFVQGKGWIGDRCLDISKVATVVGAPPKVESCK